MEQSISTTETAADVPPIERPLPGIPPLKAFIQNYGTMVITIINLGIFIYLWQMAQSGPEPLIDTRYIPKSLDMFKALIENIANGKILRHAAFTATHYTVGMSISIGVGIPFAIIVGLNPTLRSVIMTYVWLGYSTPNIAIQPIVVVILGFGLESKVFLVVLVSIYPILVNVISGVATTDPVLLKVARLFGANFRQTFIKVIIPNTLPWIMTGIRLAARRGLMGAMTAEIFGSIRGLAYMVIREAETFNSDRAFAAVLCLMALNLTVINTFSWLERKATPWRVAYRV